MDAASLLHVRPILGVALVALLACAKVAAADPEPTPSSPKRTLPDYDGRGTKPEGAGAGVWMARVVLSPLYFTSEYLLRRPLGALTVAAERGDWPRKLYDFFAFGPDHKIGFIPAGFVAFDFNPSVGIYAFWDDAFTKHNDLRLHYEAWPTDWIAASITDSYRFTDRSTVTLHVVGHERPDNVFYGIGPSTLQSAQSRYTDTRFDVSATLKTKVWRSSRVEGAAGLRKVDLSHGHFYSDPSIEEEAARTFAFTVPYGFDRGYTEPYGRLTATFDARANPKRGSGFRIEAQGEDGADVQHSPSSGWVRYGANASVFIDLNDRGRVLGLSATALFADPLGNGSIPFTELVSLGGEMWMTGYFPGRLLDRSAAVAKLSYAWPVAPWLDGDIQVAVGNVFDAHLDGFKPDLLRLSAGIGLTTNGDAPIELLVGFGTETFQQGATVDSFRIAFGFPRRF